MDERRRLSVMLAVTAWMLGSMWAGPCLGLTTKTVNPAGGADYTSLNAAYASIPNPLVDNYKITCTTTGGADDTTGAVLDARTLDGFTIVIEGDNTTGKPDEAKYQIHFTNAQTGLTMSGSGITVRYLEVVGTSFGYDGVLVTGSNIVIEKCIVHGFTRANYAAIHFGTGTTSRKAWNNVLYGCDRGLYLYQGQGTMVHNTCVGNVYNVRIYRDASCNAILKNNLCSGGTTADISIASTGGTLTTACNYTSDASSPNGEVYQSKTFTFVDAGNADYHLNANQNGLYGCTDPSLSGLTLDIDGNTRVDWDGGFDELVNGGGGTIISAYNYTSDATSPDGATYRSKVFAFVNAGANDYHLAASESGKYLCENPNVTGLTEDIDGQTRTEWDAGADEMTVIEPTFLTKPRVRPGNSGYGWRRGVLR
jgi:hypothetical protein